MSVSTIDRIVFKTGGAGRLLWFTLAVILLVLLYMVYQGWRASTGIPTTGLEIAGAGCILLSLPCLYKALSYAEVTLDLGEKVVLHEKGFFGLCRRRLFTAGDFRAVVLRSPYKSKHPPIHLYLRRDTGDLRIHIAMRYTPALDDAQRIAAAFGIPFEGLQEERAEKLFVYAIEAVALIGSIVAAIFSFS